MTDDDVELDHDDELTEEDMLDEKERELFVLFAEALDPGSPVTVADVEAEWNQ